MSLFDDLGNKNTGPMQAGNPMQMLNNLKSNPGAVLKQRGMNIPSGMNDPRQIIQHLIQSGQVPQARYLQALQMLKR